MHNQQLVSSLAYIFKGMKNDFSYLIEPNRIQDLADIHHIINIQSTTGKFFSLYFQECEK